MLFFRRQRPLHPEGSPLASGMSLTVFGPLVPAFVILEGLLPVNLDIAVLLTLTRSG
jgi:hypothetical protein